MRVEVRPPVVAGDTVVFRWTQSAPNPFQQANEFFFRYEGIDLSVFSPRLLLEIFLGLQLRVFMLHGRPVEVVLPAPLPAASIEFWRAYHNANLVTVGPADTGAMSYSPWSTNAASIGDRRSAAVFYGGGKDSVLAASLLAEIYGPDEVLAIQYVIPRRLNPSLANRMERRQEASMLRPAREHLGVATQRVWTDYLAQMQGGDYRARPHAELYTLGALPVLLSRGVSVCTFCISWTEYGFVRDPGGRLRFQNAKSRPEVLATQSKHYRRVLGADLTVTNLNLLFTGLSAVRMLAERYPRALPHYVSCTMGGVDERWCYRCRKCAWYPLFGLHCRAVHPDFDYDRLFATSAHLRRMVEYATSGVELAPSGNAPPDPSLNEDHVFPMFCHVVAGTDPDLVRRRLGPEAYGNLVTLKALFGHRSFPGFEMVPAKAIDLLDHDVARRIARIAGEHLPIVDDLPPGSLGDEPAFEYDFGVRMPTRTERLPHIKSGVASRESGATNV